MPPTGCEKGLLKSMLWSPSSKLQWLQYCWNNVPPFQPCTWQAVLGSSSENTFLRTGRSGTSPCIFRPIWFSFGFLTQVSVLLNLYFPLTKVTYFHLHTKWRMKFCGQDIENKKSGENLKMEYFLLLPIAKEDLNCCYSLI